MNRRRLIHAAVSLAAFTAANRSARASAARLFDHTASAYPRIREAWERGLAALNPTAAQLERGLELHRRMLSIDTFAFLPSVWSQEVIDHWNELREGNVGARELNWRAGLARATAPARDAAAAREFRAAIRATGLKCLVQTVAEGKSREEDIKRMAGSRQLCRVFRDTLVQAGSSEEIREADASGRTAVVWSVNGPPIVGRLEDPDEELSWIETWYNLGVRLMHLTYNRRNFIGDGCAEPANAGLSDLGRLLVARLNEVGIIVDVPHSGKQTTLDAATASTRPMMASHTGARALHDHMRLKTDEELKAIAATDGLIGVLVLPSMLGPEAKLPTLLDHVDYIAKLVGVEHVSIGTDTTYSSAPLEPVTGYPNARFSTRWWGNWTNENHPYAGKVGDEASVGSLAWTNWPLYTVGLVTRGYSDEEIEKILGGNFLRVLDATRPEKEVRI